jgi:hypothetical protein
MPNNGMIWNLNPDFNAMQLQTIMESIQPMACEASPHVAMAQQGAEATYLVIAERLVGNPRREPSISNDPVRQARSEATSLASGNRRLPNNDAWWQC